MSKINRRAFINEYRKMKAQQGISTSKVARRSRLSSSYVYHLISPKGKRPLNKETIMKIAKGLGLNAAQKQDWVDTIFHGQGSSSHFQPVMTNQGKPDNNADVPINNVKALMAKKHLDARALAKKCNMNVMYVQKFLAGRLSDFSKLDLARLAFGLGVSVKDLQTKPAKPVSKPKKHVVKPVKQLNMFRPQKPAHEPIHKSSRLRPDVRALANKLNNMTATDVGILSLIADRIIDIENNKINK